MKIQLKTMQWTPTRGFASDFDGKNEIEREEEREKRGRRRRRERILEDTISTVQCILEEDPTM